VTTTAAELLPVVDEMLVFARNRLVKATMADTVAGRDAYLATIIGPFMAALAEYFDAQAGRIALRVTKAIEPLWDPDLFDWSAEESELRALLLRWVASIGVAGVGAASEQLAIDLAWDVSSPGVREMLAEVAQRVTGITDTSRRFIREMVDIATERGYSMAELVAGVEADGFPGLGGLLRSWGSSTGRAHMIALTESAVYWNRSTLIAYEQSGLVDEVTVFDGVLDAPCAEANGKTWTLDDAMASPIAHPNCQRAFAAVVAR